MKLKLFSLITILMLSAFAVAQAQTHIGINYANVAGEIGWGVTADTEFALTQSVNVELSLNGQNTGNLYQGKVEGELSVPIGSFDIALASETSLIGSELAALGRDTAVGVKSTANINDFGITIGVFGANAGEFGPRNAEDILVEDHKFDRRQFAGLGLSALTAPSNHLSIKDGNRVNLRLEIEKEFFDGKLEAKVSARPELGAKENPVHQGILSLKTGFAVNNRAKVIVESEVGIQTWKDGYEKQGTTLLTFNFLL